MVMTLEDYNEDDNCPICEEEDHDELDHEVIASADWGRGYGLHLPNNMIDFAFMVCEALEVDVEEIKNDREMYYANEFIPMGDDRDINFESDTLDKIEYKLHDAGYYAMSDLDAGDWTVYGKVE